MCVHVGVKELFLLFIILILPVRSHLKGKSLPGNQQQVSHKYTTNTFAVGLVCFLVICLQVCPYRAGISLLITVFSGVTSCHEPFGECCGQNRAALLILHTDPVVGLGLEMFLVSTTWFAIFKKAAPSPQVQALPRRSV